MAIVPTGGGGWIFEHPLEGLINGMVHGQQLRMEMNRQADEHQAFLTNQILHNQAINTQDLLGTQAFQAAGRPVTDGMVQDRMLGAPTSRAEVPPAAGYESSLQNLPTTQTQIGGAALGGVPYLRPVDKSLLRTRKDLQGQVHQIEMYTPEEQLQRQIQAMGSLEFAKAMMGAQAGEAVTQQFGHSPSPQVLAEFPGLAGQKFSGQEIAGFEEKAAGLRAARKKLVPVPEGASLVDPEAVRNAAPAAGTAAPATTPGIPGGVPSGPGAALRQPGVLFQAPTKPTGEYEKDFLPAYAENLHGPGTTFAQLTPLERMAARSVYKKYDTNPEMLASIMQSRAMTQLFHQETLNNQQFQRGQQSYQFHAGEVDRLGKPIEDTVSRFSRLQDTLSQGTPKADALVIPELMTVMSGGQGSGLRMNEAAIAREVGGRSNWETLKAKINKWQLDPTKALSLTDEDHREVQSLMNAVGAKLAAKQALLSGARQSLSGTNDPMDHRKIVAGLHDKLAGVDTTTAAPAGGTYQHTATDPNGHKIGSNDGQNWFDLTTGKAVQ